MKSKKGLSAISCRNFIKKTADATTGAMIIPRHIMKSSLFIAPSDKLKIAEIGPGDIYQFVES